jgi:hypothetical protein
MLVDSEERLVGTLRRDGAGPWSTARAALASALARRIDRREIRLAMRASDPGRA